MSHRKRASTVKKKKINPYIRHGISSYHIILKVSLNNVYRSLTPNFACHRCTYIVYPEWPKVSKGAYLLKELDEIIDFLATQIII